MTFQPTLTIWLLAHTKPNKSINNAQLVSALFQSGPFHHACFFWITSKSHLFSSSVLTHLWPFYAKQVITRLKPRIEPKASWEPALPFQKSTVHSWIFIEKKATQLKCWKTAFLELLYHIASLRLSQQKYEKWKYVDHVKRNNISCTKNKILSTFQHWHIAGPIFRANRACTRAVQWDFAMYWKFLAYIPFHRASDNCRMTSKIHVFNDAV